ncbi:MAG: NAD-dependent succinate-semialdehyde dehydrogenase [Gammaproteobacteria bacterium]
MSFVSINPATGEEVFREEGHSDKQVDEILSLAESAAPEWRGRSVDERVEVLSKAAKFLRDETDELARIITLEMGKLYSEAKSEVEKCAWVCEYYAEEAAGFVEDEVIGTDASRSLVAYQPLGTVLAVMPWNFPFWQVFRFAAPALAAGNTALLKHASNVSQCGLAIERVFQEAGVPAGVFRTLLVRSDGMEKIIGDRRVHAVTLTGSDAAGRSVAKIAGQHLKKTVLELGGSDAFIVLPDADLDEAVAQGVKSRFQNGGQSCIAAKRFILVEAVADEFRERFREQVEALKPGDPFDEDTTLAPMARADLRDELDAQVRDALREDASLVTGCKPLDREGFYYAASIIDGISPGMRAWSEELFGPVATMVTVRDADEAVEVANASDFGLGGSVWTRDVARGEYIARRLECGAAFVNGMVKSDPRLPFGGVKESGYGRELARHGIREFVNAKTLWVK